MSSSLLQRLSLMAGVTLTEAQMQPKVKSSELDSDDSVQERKLTPAELKKREEIAKAIEKDQPGIDKSKKMAIATAQAKELSEAAKEVGWYVTNANDKEVAGPMSEKEAQKKASELGGDEKGYTVSYVSDYANMRANESAIGSNTPYSDIAEWKAACKKAGLEVYSQGAADGKYTAKKDGEAYGRFNKESGDGWIHSSAMKEAVDYDDEGNVIPEGPLPQGLAEIARQLGFQTLDTRNSDSLDFKEVSIGGVKAALLAAYNLGKTQATAQATPAEQQPQSGGLPVPQGRTSADHQQAGPVGIAR